MDAGSDEPLIDLVLTFLNVQIAAENDEDHQGHDADAGPQEIGSSIQRFDHGPDGLRLGFRSDLSSSRVEFECSINYGTQLRSTPVWEGDLMVETHFSKFPDLQKIKTNTNLT